MINVNDYRETPGGTHYRLDTPPALVDVLERIRTSRQRVAIIYRAESAPVFGRISRSMGPKLKVPIIVHNTRSFGGEPVCTTIIAEIRTSDGKQILYQAAP